jgi:hypothetical protein
VTWASPRHHGQDDVSTLHSLRGPPKHCLVYDPTGRVDGLRPVVEFLIRLAPYPAPTAMSRASYFS